MCEINGKCLQELAAALEAVKGKPKFETSPILEDFLSKFCSNNSAERDAIIDRAAANLYEKARTWINNNGIRNCNGFAGRGNKPAYDLMRQAIKAKLQEQFGKATILEAIDNLCENGQLSGAAGGCGMPLEVGCLDPYVPWAVKLAPEKCELPFTEATKVFEKGDNVVRLANMKLSSIFCNGLKLEWSDKKDEGSSCTGVIKYELSYTEISEPGTPPEKVIKVILKQNSQRYASAADANKIIIGFYNEAKTEAKAKIAESIQHVFEAIAISIENRKTFINKVKDSVKENSTAATALAVYTALTSLGNQVSSTNCNDPTETRGPWPVFWRTIGASLDPCIDILTHRLAGLNPADRPTGKHHFDFCGGVENGEIYGPGGVKLPYPGPDWGDWPPSIKAIWQAFAENDTKNQGGACTGADNKPNPLQQCCSSTDIQIEYIRQEGNCIRVGVTYKFDPVIGWLSKANGIDKACSDGKKEQIFGRLKSIVDMLNATRTPFCGVSIWDQEANTWWSEQAEDITYIDQDPATCLYVAPGPKVVGGGTYGSDVLPSSCKHYPTFMGSTLEGEIAFRMLILKEILSAYRFSDVNFQASGKAIIDKINGIIDNTCIKD